MVAWLSEKALIDRENYYTMDTPGVTSASVLSTTAFKTETLQAPADEQLVSLGPSQPQPMGNPMPDASQVPGKG
ncbi:hypothetical protein SARC_16384 [Sphaeroforma arctica JP610]|uniref:Uncharacterized protein n=1 Tax=Sphaeroforma arctica JP610 TaxID=667725 RepID=A0A0L0F301_9EUKA|nr:hypothetical protein SARC_16384 [Sphaeroforma arctica JP610]KNC71080.1 hypothetical protein SARC_16384 [Sphaeroforma arctica JP610]|eukprot:XP_014144982.1 hypothetical protein SARC_16384 [Sphaeroforma arctica JP610]